MATAIRLDQTTIKTSVGAVRRLSVIVVPSNSEDEIVWSSSNESVATVDENGLIVACGEGSAVISVTVGGLTDSCAVSVDRNYLLVSVAEAKRRLSIDFDNQDDELQSRIDSIIADLTFGTGIKASEFASLDAEIQNLAKEYVLRSLYYDYYDLHSELNDSRLTRIMKQLQFIATAL